MILAVRITALSDSEVRMLELSIMNHGAHFVEECALC